MLTIWSTLIAAGTAGTSAGNERQQSAQGALATWSAIHGRLLPVERAASCWDRGHPCPQ
jgi:hypothetical protein